MLNFIFRMEDVLSGGQWTAFWWLLMCCVVGGKKLSGNGKAQVVSDALVQGICFNFALLLVGRMPPGQ